MDVTTHLNKQFNFQQEISIEHEQAAGVTLAEAAVQSAKHSVSFQPHGQSPGFQFLTIIIHGKLR